MIFNIAVEEDVNHCRSLSDDVLIYILRKKVTYQMIDVTSDAPELHGLLNIIVDKNVYDMDP